MTNINRRIWMKSTATAATVLVASTIRAQETNGTKAAPAIAPLDQRIYKGVKSGRKKGESAEQFFERLKGLGFDGVESGDPADAAAYAPRKERFPSWNRPRVPSTWSSRTW